MQVNKAWKWLLVVGLLLAACAFSLGKYHDSRCQEKYGAHYNYSNSGELACTDEDGNVVGNP